MLSPDDATYVLGILFLGVLMLIEGILCYAFALFAIALIMKRVLER